jgi:hypothetical protein
MNALGWAALLLAAVRLTAAEPPLRVLFIGNSYTYFNNSPAMFAALAAAAAPGRQVETGMATVPGATLLSTWEHSDARRILKSSKWDYVVLQDQSRLGEALRDGRWAVNSAVLLRRGVGLFDADIRQVGAQTALTLTWARRDEPQQQADLDDAYGRVARELGAILVPAGPAWQRARRLMPDLELYTSDGSHPSPAGSYMLACVLVAALVPEAAGDLPFEISGHPVRNARADESRTEVLVSLPPEKARELQRLARAAVNDLRRSGGYPEPRPPVPPKTPAGDITAAPPAFAGSWTGELSYYPTPANLDLTLRVNGAQCEGEVTVRVPERMYRYDAPLQDCSVAGQELRFTVASMPLPALFDRFTARIAGDRLAGEVERSGRDLVTAMTGTWSLRRQTAQ